MALLFVDPFENGATGVNLNAEPNASLFQVRVVIGQSQFVRIVNGTLSDKQVVIKSNGGSSHQQNGFVLLNGVHTDEKITVGFALSVSSNINNTPSGISVGNTKPLSFSNHVNSILVINSDGSCTIGDLTSAPGLFLDSVYSYVEVTVDYGTGSFDLWVNNVHQGSGLMSFSGEQKVQFGATGVTSSNLYEFYDDIYILDDTGTTHNQRLGPVRAVRVPFNATTETNFTPVGVADNITAINKGSPDTSTFNRSPANNDVGDYFKLDTTGLPTDRDIIATSTTASYRKDDIGARTLQLFAKLDANETSIDLSDRLATFTGSRQHINAAAPDGTIWDLTKLQNAEFGYKVAQ